MHITLRMCMWDIAHVQVGGSLGKDGPFYTTRVPEITRCCDPQTPKEA